ncbi:MAG: UDP-N-acetylmuramoyl-tripeptide--D-alanyl-D-alanine ligase, partial [Oscillospiraceae bacterium]|nr:UDP-N-acetylmuramoyl-tripeptide--D-alanyl-D-alanine ligase [Oscillospiraceae bacterium]
MEPLKLSEILKAVNGTCPKMRDIFITEISTDSRSIPDGSLFLALTGEKFDGNKFVDEAFTKGASACVAQKDSPFVDKTAENLILVENTEKALLNIAHLYRSKLSLKLVGVTGSVGKTTTKEMISAVLSKRFKTHKTQGNLNNQIGLPKTLLQLEKSVEMAVIEMGMSDLGEIHELSVCATPDISVITTI